MGKGEEKTAFWDSCGRPYNCGSSSKGNGSFHQLKTAECNSKSTPVEVFASKDLPVTIKGVNTDPGNSGALEIINVHEKKTETGADGSHMVKSTPKPIIIKGNKIDGSLLCSIDQKLNALVSTCPVREIGQLTGEHDKFAMSPDMAKGTNEHSALRIIGAQGNEHLGNMKVACTSGDKQNGMDYLNLDASGNLKVSFDNTCDAHVQTVSLSDDTLMQLKPAVQTSDNSEMTTSYLKVDNESALLARVASIKKPVRKIEYRVISLQTRIINY